MLDAVANEARALKAARMIVEVLIDLLSANTKSDINSNVALLLFLSALDSW